MTNRLLIKNATILTLGENSQLLFDHALLVEDGLIKQIAKVKEIKCPFDKVIDATNKLVMPGFINTHMHFYSTLVRGLGKAAPSANFQEILNNLWWRLDKQLTLEDSYISTLVMALNAIRHGTTTFIDHHASPNAVSGSLQQVAKGIKDAGLRGCLCYELSDRDGEKIAKEGIEENAAFIRTCQNHPDDQLKALFGLHASFTVSEKTLEQAVGVAQSLNTGFHVHVAEAESDQANTIKMCGQRVIERFKRQGVLGSNTIVAHCVHVSADEMDLLADTDTMVVHNPQSNMNNAVGIANIIELMKRNILVGLGTDAMTVNMFEEVRVALWAQHLRANNPSVGFMECCDALFVNNAKIANRIWGDTKLGVLQVGAAADIVLIDYRAPTPFEINSALGHLIFGVSQQLVDTTIVKGRILMENKVLKLDLDETELSLKSQRLAEKLWQRF